MAIDTKNIPNKPPFDDIREALLDLEDQIDDTGGSVTNSTITITAGSNMTGGGSFTLNQSNNEEITLNASDQSMTDAEVKTAYENNSDTNAFTDSEKTKLGNISSVGSGDIITTVERTKLTSIEESADVTDTDNVTTAINSISVTAHSDVSDAGSGFIITGTERTKLTNIEAGADVTDANNVAAAGAIMDGDFSSNGLMKRTGVGAYSIATASDINALNVDADTLDGQDSTYYINYNNLTNTPTIPSTTDQITEGSNLYYTDARADSRVVNATGSNLDLSAKTTTELSEGDNLYYTNARADARITAVIDTDAGFQNALDTLVPSQLAVKSYVDAGLTNIDADTLDGEDGTYYLDYNNLNNKPTVLDTEGVQDVVGDQFVTNANHTGISFSYDDANNGAINATISGDYKTKDQFIGGSRITISENMDGDLEISADVRNLDATPIVNGLALYTDIQTYVNSNSATIGFLDGNTTVTAPSTREVYFVNGTGINLTFTEDDTDNSNYDSLEISAVSASVTQAGIIQLANNTESNDSNVTDRAITPAGLANVLSNEISTPNLQQVTNNDGNVTTNFLGVGSFDPSNNDDPLAPLHIKNSDTLKVILDNNSATKSEIKLSDSASTSLYVGTINGFGYVSQNSGNSSDAGISIKQTNGNVGIGVAVDDTQKLKVGGALLATGNISSSEDVVAVNVDASGDVTAGASITLDADVGTVFATNADFSGTLTVDTLSSLDGGVHIGDNFTISNTGTIAGTGAVWNGAVIASAYLDSDTAHLSGVQTFSGAKTFTQNVTALDFVLSGSDRKLKKDIQPIQKESFDFEFKQYKYKGKDDLRYGVIAQDIEEKHPEFVKETEYGIKTVSYIDLLVAKVAELENRVKELENANT